MKQKNSIFIIILLSFAIELLTSPLRVIAFKLCSVITFIVYFIFICLILNKYAHKIKPLYILIFSILGCSLLMLPIHVFDFESTLVSFLDYLFHLLGILLGFCFFLSKKIMRIGVLCFSIFSCIFLYFGGYDMWLHNIGYGTPNGRITAEPLGHLCKDFKIQNIQGDTLSLTDFTGKYLIMDFWFTFCGICYQDMPKVQMLYEKYMNTSDIEVISIHSRLTQRGENHVSGEEILRKENYSIPCYSINIEDTILNALGVKSYPTVLIIDTKNENLIFRGGIEPASKFIEKIIKVK